jgi:hypothetical protein
MDLCNKNEEYYLDDTNIYIINTLFENIAKEYINIYNLEYLDITKLFNHYPIFVSKISYTDTHVKLDIEDFKKIIINLVKKDCIITVESIRFYISLLNTFDIILDDTDRYSITKTALLQEKYSIYKLYENRIELDKYILFDIFNNFITWINTKPELVHEYFKNKLFGCDGFDSMYRIYNTILDNDKYKKLLNIHDDRNFHAPLLHTVINKLQNYDQIIKLVNLLVNFGANPYEYNYIGPEDMHRVAKDKINMSNLYFTLCDLYPNRIIYDYEIFNKEKKVRSLEDAFNLSIIDLETKNKKDKEYNKKIEDDMIKNCEYMVNLKSEYDEKIKSNIKEQEIRTKEMLLLEDNIKKQRYLIQKFKEDNYNDFYSFYIVIMLDRTDIPKKIIYNFYIVETVIKEKFYEYNKKKINLNKIISDYKLSYAPNILFYVLYRFIINLDDENLKSMIRIYDTLFTEFRYKRVINSYDNNLFERSTLLHIIVTKVKDHELVIKLVDYFVSKGADIYSKTSLGGSVHSLILSENRQFYDKKDDLYKLVCNKYPVNKQVDDNKQIREIQEKRERYYRNNHNGYMDYHDALINGKKYRDYHPGAELEE